MYIDQPCLVLPRSATEIRKACSMKVSRFLCMYPCAMMFSLLTGSKLRSLISNWISLTGSCLLELPHFHFPRKHDSVRVLPPGNANSQTGSTVTDRLIYLRINH